MNRKIIGIVIAAALSSNAYASSELNVKVDLGYDALGSKAVINSNKSFPSTPKYLWLNDANEKIGDEQTLYLSYELQKTTAYVVGCERQSANDGSEMVQGCSEQISLSNLEFDERDARPVVSEIVVDGFPAIGSTVTVSYTYSDLDDGDSEDPAKARFKWEYAKSSSPEIWGLLEAKIGDPNLVIPTEVGSPATKLEAGDLIRVSVQAYTAEGGEGADSSVLTTSSLSTVFENYPGGNIVDQYYRPLLIDETAIIEADNQTYAVDANGEPTSAGDAYKFALLNKDDAIAACEGLKLELLSNPDEFSTLMNANGMPGEGGEASKWPQHKIYWTSKDAPESIWGDYYSVAHEDGVGFEVFETSTDSLGLVVCKSKSEEI